MAVVPTTVFRRQPGLGQQLAASAGPLILDALLKALLSGQLGQQPTGKSTLQLPGGGTAQPGPGLQAQLAAGQLPQLIQQKQFPAGTTAVPQTKFGFGPSLAQQTQKVNLALKQRQLSAPSVLEQLQQFGILPSGVGAPTAPGVPLPSGPGQPTPPIPRPTPQTSGLGLTGFDLDPVTGNVNLKFGETPESKAARGVEVEAKKALAKRRAETQEGFRTAVGLFQNFNAQFESKLLAQAGQGGVGPGILGFVAGKLRLPGKEAIEATQGQIQETALAMSRIITGQRRVIKGVVQMIKETIPDRFDTREFKNQKLAQSVSNMFRLFIASNRGLISENIVEGFDNSEFGQSRLEEFLDQVGLTPNEESQLEQLIDTVLSTPAAPLQSEVRKGKSGGFKVIREF